MLFYEKFMNNRANAIWTKKHPDSNYQGVILINLCYVAL